MARQIEALSFLDDLIDGKVTPGKIVRARRVALGFTKGLTVKNSIVFIGIFLCSFYGFYRKQILL